MEIESLSEEGYVALLKRLGGSGYTRADDSARVAELRAVAQIAVRAAEGLTRMSRDLLLASADEALDAYERVRFFVAGARFTPERRRARLRAFAVGAAKLVEARLREAALRVVGSATGSTVTVARPAARAHQATPFSGLVVARKEPNADKHTRRDLEPVLERGLPSRVLGRAVYTDDAAYGLAFEGRAMAIAPVPAVDVAPAGKARVAPIEMHPGKLVTRDDWIELQAMLLWKSHGFSLGTAHAGRTVFVDEALDAGEELVVDGPTANTGVSWAHSIVQVWGVSAAAAGADLTTRAASEHVWLAPSKVGNAGGGRTHALVAFDGAAAAITVHVDADGNLVISNEGALKRYLTLFVRVLPPYVPSSSTDSEPWLDTTRIPRSALAELYASTLISDQTPGRFGGAPAAALRRIVYTGGLTRPSTVGGTARVLLDTSEDWRGRYVLVVPITTALGPTGVVVPPAAGCEGMTPRSARAQAPRLWFTGAGASGDAAAAGPYQHPDALTVPNVWLYIDADGALWAEMKTVSANECACLMALLVATEPTTGGVTRAVPVHATAIQTIDLEQPQNTGCYAQGMQGGVPRYALTDPAPKRIPTAPPLGLLSEGATPPRPVSWLVRERLGSAADGTYEVRQPIVGQRKRIVSIALAPESVTPVDVFNRPTDVVDQMDFRDRMVWVEGRLALSNLTVAAGDASDVDTVPFLALFYAGPYADITVPITDDISLRFEFSRAAEVGGYHSPLVIVNRGEAAAYVQATIECSGFLGLTDLRQYGVINAFTYASGDNVELEENLGYSDDFGISGGSYVRAEGE